MVLGGIIIVKTADKKEQNKPLKSILDQIIGGTFDKLDEMDIYDDETMIKLRELSKNGSLNDKKQLVSILRNDFDENNQAGN